MTAHDGDRRREPPAERDEIRVDLRGSIVGVGVVVGALLGLIVMAALIAVAASLL